MVARGDIWIVRLDPTEGHELQKTRPALVVSPSEINDNLGIALVVPLTTGSRLARFRMPVHFDGQDGLILLEQIRVLDRRRFERRLGTIDRKALSNVLSTLQALFAE
ncbi:MAG: type II toxin-antitoxin system PemK/MazF family toxin [Alphaproteobacteria bacterium]